jgi:hypothetical protein
MKKIYIIIQTKARNNPCFKNTLFSGYTLKRYSSAMVSPKIIEECFFLTDFNNKVNNYCLLIKD